MEIEKLLPIGSVVGIFKEQKRVMVVGYYSKKEGLLGEHIYEYMGCYYPMGINLAHKLVLFDHNQIKLIYHLGLEELEAQIFLRNIKEEYKKYKDKISKSKSKSEPVQTTDKK